MNKRTDHRAKKLVASALGAAAAASLVFAANAHADTHDEFESAAANIGCVLDSGSDGRGIAHCAAQDHTWVIVAPVPNCGSGSGDWEFVLAQGNGPTLPFSCAAGRLSRPGLATIDYGQTRSAGAITCDSEPSGMRCTDSGTGHFFRVSHESYQLG